MADVGVRGFGLEEAREVLAAQSFSVLLGAELVAFENGRAELAVPLAGDFRQQGGVAHGGLVSYLADNALTFAAGSSVGPEVMTAEMKLNYVASARGDRLVAVATVVKAGSRLVTVRCDVFDERASERWLCAVALGTVARMGSSARAEALAMEGNAIEAIPADPSPRS